MVHQTTSGSGSLPSSFPNQDAERQRPSGALQPDSSGRVFVSSFPLPQELAKRNTGVSEVLQYRETTYGAQDENSGRYYQIYSKLLNFIRYIKSSSPPDGEAFRFPAHPTYQQAGRFPISHPAGMTGGEV